MGKYFGTDGIRGMANLELDGPLAYQTGVALARMLGREQERPLVYIGRDTRISGPMLEAALTAGLCAGGADVCSLGVLPTPAVAFLTAKGPASAGIVISASHNSFEDNGIKIFGDAGFKLTDGQEDQIEALIDEKPGDLPAGAGLGRTVAFEGDPSALYAAHVTGTGKPVSGMKVLFDCANGAASHTAKLIFPPLGIKAAFMADAPDGVNINRDCGSTHMDALCRRVREEGFDLGVAFDGDADRCLICDENGVVIDGDRILAVLATDMAKLGTLKGGVVGTIVSNLGLHAYLKERGVGVAATGVGDRYVLQGMLERGWNLGGEQSGHVILTDYGTTGDGQMTALHVLAALGRQGGKASDIVTNIVYYPQTTINVPVPNALKHTVVELAPVSALLDEIALLFGEEGRILVRPSGTEAKVRVMVEGREEALVRQMAEKAARTILAEVEKLQT